MEENENFILKLVASLKIRKKRKNKINWDLIMCIIIIIVFIFLLLIILSFASENKKMKKIIQNNNYNRDKQENLNPSLNLYKRDNISLQILGKDYMVNIIHYNDNKFSKTKNEIHVSYSLDNKLIYPTYISMVSGLENCNESNILVYHLLFSHDFDTSEISFFETLKDNYKVKIFYYIIPNIFIKSPKWTSGTDCVYYKILLPFIFPEFERMIYLDGDTLIRKDIYEMYNCPFNDNYILGYPFYMGYIMKKYGIEKPKHYINGGCLLFNIKKIREDKKDIYLLEITIKRTKPWGFLEQDSINYAFNPNVGFLPLKYGIYMMGNNNIFKLISEHYIFSKINLTEGYEAVKDPAIVHFSCCWPKVWTNGTKNLFKDKKICLRYQEEFYYYANKTRFYSDIYNKLFFQKIKKKKKGK